jgi:hypothetical protein
MAVSQMEHHLGDCFKLNHFLSGKGRPHLLLPGYKSIHKIAVTGVEWIFVFFIDVKIGSGFSG